MWSVGCIFGELVKGSPMFMVREREREVDLAPT